MNKIIAGVIMLAVIVSLIVFPIDARGNSVYDKNSFCDNIPNKFNEKNYLKLFKNIKPKLCPQEKGVIIFRMDDVQAWWKEAEAKTLVRNHINKGVPVTLGVVPRDLKYREGVAGSITEKLKEWNANDSYMVDIAIHGYDHSVDYSGLSLAEQVEDIENGISIFEDLGIEVTTFISPFNGGNEYTPQAMVDTGLKVWPLGVENSFIESSNNPMVLENGIMYKREFSNWDYNEVNELIDEKIAEKGYLVIVYHQQDFDVSDRTGFKEFRVFLKNLVKSDKYEFMTAEQYYKRVNG